MSAARVAEMPKSCPNSAAPSGFVSRPRYRQSTRYANFSCGVRSAAWPTRHIARRKGSRGGWILRAGRGVWGLPSACCAATVILDVPSVLARPPLLTAGRAPSYRYFPATHGSLSWAADTN